MAAAPTSPSRAGSALLLGAAAALLAVAAAALRLAGAGWPALVGRTPGDPADALVSLVALAAAGLAAWLALGLLACLAAAVPGAVGRAAGGVAERLTPALVRRVAATALGGAVLAGGLAPVAASAAGSGPDGPGVVGTSTWSAQVTTSGLSPDLAPTVGPTTGPRTGPAASVPTPAIAAATATTRAAAPGTPVVRGLGALSPATPRAVAPDPARVVVRAGDCLWDLAAAHLPPGADDASVARATQAWYAANRAVIGPDPDRIEPGQVLLAPDQAGGR